MITRVGAFSYTNWAGDATDRKSTSGMVLMFNGTAVSWAIKKQSSTALSSTESEYIALSLCGKKVRWSRRILGELGVDVTGLTDIFEDNFGAISWASKTKRSKHIEIKYHLVRELLAKSIVSMQYSY